MKHKELVIAVVVGLGLLIALVGGVRTAPALHAASPALNEQPTVQQGLLAQIVVTPTKDNTLYESATGNTSNGAGEYFFVGNIRLSSIRRGLIAFDLTAKLPSGATIVSATLKLQMSQTRGGASPVSLHRVLSNWGEGSSNAGDPAGSGAPATTGDATWLHTFYDTARWQTSGGDFVPTATATISVAGVGSYIWPSTPALVADIQDWLDHPTSNFGWVLVGDESATQTAKRFDSSENLMAANRPQLTIVYSVTMTEPAAVYLPLVRKE